MKDAKTPCSNCTCNDCMCRMWDGGVGDCFHCEYCTNGDKKKQTCHKKLEF